MIRPYRKRVDEEGQVILEELIPMTAQDKSGGKMLVYNPSDNIIEESDVATLDDLTVGNLHVTNDAEIQGDLFVKGTAHIVKSETEVVTGDYIVLRESAETGVGSGFSGYIINNYDGNNSKLVVVVDGSGTLKIGTQGTENDEVYNNIKWDKANEEYVDSDNNALDPQPSGFIVSKVTTNEDDDFITYETITFTTVDTDDLQPFLTRGDSLTEGALFIWDGVKAVTIDTPTNGFQVLRSNADNDTLEWVNQDNMGKYVRYFETEEEYEEAKLIPVGQSGHISDGTLVVIGTEEYLTAEEQINE